MTSDDILRERDELSRRVRELERANARMAEEIEVASERPGLAFTTLCRVATILRSQRAR